MINEKTRNKYNQKRPELEKEKILELSNLGEQFEEGAFRGFQDNRNNKPEPKLISKERQNIIDKMGVLVKQILNSPTNNAVKKLQDLEDAIRKQNEKEGVRITDFSPNAGVIKKKGKDIKE